VANPVELITRSRHRLARLAAYRTALCASLPIAITIAIGLSVNAIAALVWDRFGYMLDAGRAAALERAIFGLAAAEIAALVFFAWRAWTEANDFTGAARRIDEIVGGRQEILTLAALADPAHPEGGKMRTPLFPMLWRRAIAYLDLFDPRREFRLEVGEPLKRSTLYGGAAAIALGIATMALMRAPTPMQSVTHRLRQFANSINAGEPAPLDHQLAQAARDVAKDMENPSLPPEQKIAELQAIKQQIEHHQSSKDKGQSAAGAAGGGSGSGNGNGSGSGSGSGKGSSGKGEGAGSGAGGNGDKSGQQTIELRNDIAKAQAKLAEQSNSGDKSNPAPKSQEQKGAGIAPAPGNDPKQPGGANKPNGTGNIPLPEPGSLAQGRMPSGDNPGGRKNDKGSQGDTHLGEIPKAVAFERYYNAGDKGPPIAIRDARYVTFRLPTDVVSGNGEGKAVRDTAHPNAAAPYTNAPLKEQRLAVSPDEEQLVPPRYRDLIQ
jgi:uncharacterized membrane protein YgcG